MHSVNEADAAEVTNAEYVFSGLPRRLPGSLNQSRTRMDLSAGWVGQIFDSSKPGPKFYPNTDPRHIFTTLGDQLLLRATFGTRKRYIGRVMSTSAPTVSAAGKLLAI